MWVGNFKLLEPLPELRQPHVIGSLSPWVNVGKSATIALERLERDIDARDLASLANPGRYFDFTRYRPTIFSIEGRRETSIPNVHVKYARGHAGIDFVTMRLLEPHANTDEYVDSIVELMQRLGVERYCRIGSMWSDVPHTRPLPVMATLNGEDMGLPGTMVRQQSRYSGRTSIMNLVGSRAAEQGIEDANILVRLPSIARLDEDHSGVSRLLGTLCYMYGFPAGLADNREGQQQYQQVSRQIEQNPELRYYLKELEATYDSWTASQGERPLGPPYSMPPGLEQLLDDIEGQL